MPFGIPQKRKSGGLYSVDAKSWKAQNEIFLPYYETVCTLLQGTLSKICYPKSAGTSLKTKERKDIKQGFIFITINKKPVLCLKCYWPPFTVQVFKLSSEIQKQKGFFLWSLQQLSNWRGNKSKPADILTNQIVKLSNCQIVKLSNWRGNKSKLADA